MLELIIGVAIGALITFLLLKTLIPPPKDVESAEKAKFQEIYRKKTDELHQAITEEKENMYQRILQDRAELQKEHDQKRIEFEKELQAKKNNIKETLELDLKQYEENFQKKKIEIEEKYKSMAEEYDEAVKIIETKLEEWKGRQEAVIEANKREYEIKQKENFYKISLSETEEEELKELNKAIRKLRNPMPFRKAVYDIYYKQKVNDLANRVVGRERKTGIYKITHIETQKVYVGQSVDIGNRWKQHAKRGCGADQLTKNKLYPAMLEEGIHSFSWEVLEETTQEKLSEAEKYWQEFYKAKDFGYSIR